MSRRFITSMMLTLILPGFGLGLYYAGVSLAVTLMITVGLRIFQLLLMEIFYPAISWPLTWFLAPTVRLGLEVFLVWLAFVAMNLGRLPRTQNRNYIRYAFGAILVITLYNLSIQHFDLRPSTSYHVPTASMQPNILAGDRVLVNRMAYHNNLQIRRGDIVVFEHPKDPKTTLVKRVIALGNDQIQVKENRLVINGNLLVYHKDEAASGTGSIKSLLESNHAQTYKILQSPDSHSWGYLAGEQPITLAADEIFVMGDNRVNSIDSRIFGPIRSRSILGKTEGILFSINPETNSPRWTRILKFFSDQ